MLPQPHRDIVLALFSATLSLSGILLALVGFLFSRYDALKADTTIDVGRLTPFRWTLGFAVALVFISSLCSLLALGWLIGLGFDYPLWLVLLLLVAIPTVGAVSVRLRW
jgi:hypothetical protein